MVPSMFLWLPSTDDMWRCFLSASHTNTIKLGILSSTACIELLSLTMQTTLPCQHSHDAPTPLSCYPTEARQAQIGQGPVDQRKLGTA